MATKKKTTSEKTPATKAASSKAEAKPRVLKKPMKTAAEQPPADTPPSEKRLSALDAAAKVLADSGEPLTTKQMIEAMAAKSLWTSPGGKTPHATLYSAILREIKVKGNDARFKKTDRGKFQRNA